MIKNLQIVFCMDTEGPCADPANNSLLSNWELVETAVDKLFDKSLRYRILDKFGNHFKISWFFLTWSGFRTNPRGRDMGYHRIRDHYIEKWGNKIDEFNDEHCWHYHHPPVSGIGNEWGLNWLANNEYENIISRQIIERSWFPVCFRAGGTIQSPESSRWVDNWFPIDYSNRAPVKLHGLVDWSDGQKEWGLYHPSVEKFQYEGSGRRLMARTMDLLTNAYTTTENDIETAFLRAQTGLPAILSVFDHDYRDIEQRIIDFQDNIQKISKKYPDVKWQFSTAIEAVKNYLDAPAQNKLLIEAIHDHESINIWTNQTIFQTYPWIAVKNNKNQVFQLKNGIIRIDDTHFKCNIRGIEWDEIGIACSTSLGESSVIKLNFKEKPFEYFFKQSISVHPNKPNSIWEYSKFFPESCLKRASGEAEELDSVKQAVEILKPLLKPKMSLLDVGCAAGHAFLSFNDLDIEYYGLDSHQRAIEIGRFFLSKIGLPFNRLKHISIDDLQPTESYDAVICLSTFYYFPMYHKALEIMARSTKKWLLIRSSFGNNQEIRYLEDRLLDNGYKHISDYFNIFSKTDIQNFLENRNFRVRWIEDNRQSDKFEGKVEVVGGISLPAEIIFAERIG